MAKKISIMRKNENVVSLRNFLNSRSVTSNRKLTKTINSIYSSEMEDISRFVAYVEKHSFQ